MKEIPFKDLKVEKRKKFYRKRKFPFLYRTVVVAFSTPIITEKLRRAKAYIQLAVSDNREPYPVDEYTRMKIKDDFDKLFKKWRLPYEVTK